MAPDHMPGGATTSEQIFPTGLDDGLSLKSPVTTTDPLVVEVVDSLRLLLNKRGSSLYDTMEMKHVLLLLVKAFHDLCQEMAFQKDVWLQRIRETAGQIGPYTRSTREQAGFIIAEIVEEGVWSLMKRPGQTRSDMAHTVLAVYKGIVLFLKALEDGLKQKAATGTDLKQYEVDEMLSTDEEERRSTTAQPATKATKIPKIIIHPPKPPRGKLTAPKPPSTSSSASASPPPPSRGPGNYNHGLFTVWTIAEWIHLLKLYRDHPNLMGKEIAQLHNDGYWVPKGRTVKRSTDSVRQQYKKVMGKGTKEETAGRIPEKIRELEGKAREAAEKAGVVVGEEGGDEE